MTTAWPRAAAPVADVWQELSRPTRAPEHFDPGALTDLPEPARRWLTHAIAPGTPLWRSAALRMHGHIRLGSWRPFRARQVLAPGAGYVWAATARFTGLPVIGYDRYDAGTADMRWRLCGLLPVVTATGPDVVRSAAGRLAAEGVVVPTAFRGAVWADGPTPDSATATWTSAGQAETIELHVAPGGQLESVVVRPPRGCGPAGSGARPGGATASSSGPRSRPRPGGDTRQRPSATRDRGHLVRAASSSSSSSDR